MARPDPAQNITLSVLDRLIDNDPAAPADPPAGRSQSLRQLKAALRRDLEWLLNTRRTPIEIDDPDRELYRSVFNYGLPDISNLGMHSNEDQNRLLWMMESTLAAFEPRLLAPQITLEPPNASSRVLRFRVEGMLNMDPAPERVSFDTVLELVSREYEVKAE